MSIGKVLQSTLDSIKFYLNWPQSGSMKCILSEKVSFWLFKIFEIQKGRTFSFNDIL